MSNKINFKLKLSVLLYKYITYIGENVSSAFDSSARIRYPVRPHTLVSPSADLRRAIISYWRKYVHLGLINRLGGISLPGNSVVRLIDHLK